MCRPPAWIPQKTNYTMCKSQSRLSNRTTVYPYNKQPPAVDQSVADPPPDTSSDTINEQKLQGDTTN